MSFELDAHSTEATDTFSERYRLIEAANSKSFYLTNPNRTLDVYQSIYSLGPARINQQEHRGTLPASMRTEYDGNMSPFYEPDSLSSEEKIANTQKRMSAFLASLGIPETSAYMLYPDRDYSTPLNAIDLDTLEIDTTTEFPYRLETPGDFIFTRDPNKVLLVRPADCPVMLASADTPNGKIYMMVHYAWMGAASGYVEQTSEIFNSLGVDTNSLEIFLTPGAQAENFVYTNYPINPLEKYPGSEGLFTHVTPFIGAGGPASWDFRIDTPKFIYDQVIKRFGITPEQVFCDTTDTSALNTGYSSQTRSANLKKQNEPNGRDLVVAVFNSGR